MAKKLFNLETDLRNSPEILARIEDKVFAESLYAALCNNQFRHAEMTDGNRDWSCTWRYAGEIVSDIRNRQLLDKNEDYMDYYCSGRESEITPDVETLLASMGWERIGGWSKWSK